jgi:hypothetical protein
MTRLDHGDASLLDHGEAWMDHCSTLLRYCRAMVEYSPAMLQYSRSIRLYSRSMIQYSGDGDASWRWIMDKDGWMMKTDDGDTRRINHGVL